MSRRGGKRHAKPVLRSAVPGASWEINPRGGRTLIDGGVNNPCPIGWVAPHQKIWRVDLLPTEDPPEYPVLASFFLTAPTQRAAMRLLEDLVNRPARCARIQKRFDETGEIDP